MQTYPAFPDRKSRIAFEHFGSHVVNAHPLESDRFSGVIWVGPFKFDAADRVAFKDGGVPVGNDAAAFRIEGVDSIARLAASRERM